MSCLFTKCLMFYNRHVKMILCIRFEMILYTYVFLKKLIFSCLPKMVSQKSGDRIFSRSSPVYRISLNTSKCHIYFVTIINNVSNIRT